MDFKDYCAAAIAAVIAIGQRHPELRARRALIADLERTPPIGYSARFGEDGNGAYDWYARIDSAYACARADDTRFSLDECRIMNWLKNAAAYEMSAPGQMQLFLRNNPFRA